MPFLTAQLLFRRSSEVIVRCVADAPLETMADNYISGTGAIDLCSLAAGNKRMESDLHDLAARLEAQAEAMRQEEQDLRAMVHRAFPAGARRGAPLVVSHAAVRPRAHVPASRYYPELPIFEWKSRCGWTFGLAEFTPVGSVPPGARMCASCLGRAGAGPPAEPISSSSDDAPPPSGHIASKGRRRAQLIVSPGRHPSDYMSGVQAVHETAGVA